MADSRDYATDRPRPMRLDSQTTLSLALVIALVGGGIQYGKQSQRLESVEYQLVEIKSQLRELTTALSAAGVRIPITDRR